MFRRTLGQPALFAIIYTSVASAIYFSLGVVAARALGLTPFVYILAGIFFALACTTYVEGASLHQDRGGATVFARYAFNELVSFVAGWMILLDYIILIAVTAFSATNYLAAFYAPLGQGRDELLLCFAIIGYVAVRNVRGFSKTRVNRIAALVVADLGLQALIIVLGLFAFFHLDTITDTIHFGDTPTWGDTVFALGVATVSFTGLESASGLSGEVAVGRRGLKRLVGAAAIIVIVVYTGIGIVAVTALPVVGNATSLGRNYLDAPMIGIAESFHNDALADVLKYTIAAAAAATLIAAANSAMMGLSRLAYSLSTNRQIPSAVGRLHPTRSTPYVVITIAALLAAGLTVPQDLELLVGIFAYGALVGLTIAHLSIVVLRYKEPDGRRPYRIPLSVRVGGGRPAAARGVRRGPQRRGVGRARHHPRGRALGGHGVARRRRRPVPRLPHHAGQVGPAARARPRGRAARRAPRGGVRLDPGAALGLAAGRRHHPDRGPTGRRGGRRVLRGPGRHHRGAVDLRGPDVAADRRRAARGAAQAGARRAGARQGGGGGVRGRRGRHRHGARAARRAGDRRRGQAPRRAGGGAGGRGAVEDPRRRAAGRARRTAGRLRGGGDQVRAGQGAVPGHPHRAARLRHAQAPDLAADAVAPRGDGAVPGRDGAAR